MFCSNRIQRKFGNRPSPPQATRPGYVPAACPVQYPQNKEASTDAPDGAEIARLARGPILCWGVTLSTAGELVRARPLGPRHFLFRMKRLLDVSIFFRFFSTWTV